MKVQYKEQNGTVGAIDCGDDEELLTRHIDALDRSGSRITSITDNQGKTFSRRVAYRPVTNSGQSPLTLPKMNFNADMNNGVTPATVSGPNAFPTDSSGNQHIETVLTSIPQQATAGKKAKFAAALLAMIETFDWSDKPESDSQTPAQGVFGTPQGVNENAAPMVRPDYIPVAHGIASSPLPMPSMRFDPPPRKQADGGPTRQAKPVVNNVEPGLPLPRMF